MLNEIQTEATTATSPGASTQTELLVSAVLHLMSHYSVHTKQAHQDLGLSRLASTIERHLIVLINLPDLTPVLRATCEQLLEHWHGLVQQSPSKTNKSRWLSWLTSNSLSTS